MKKKKKIICIVLIFIIILSIIYNDVDAAYSVTDLTGTQLNNQKALSFGNTIITILTTIGSVLSVIVLIVIGLKYMLGSVEEKASYKKSLFPYVIGAVFVFGASLIAGIIFNVLTNV